MSLKSRCNRCGGVPEFRGTLFNNKGKVLHRYACLCGAVEDREVAPGWDMEHPLAQRTMRLTPDYRQRIGL